MRVAKDGARPHVICAHLCQFLQLERRPIVDRAPRVIRCDARAAARLIHHIDRFVRQLPVGHVARGEAHCGGERLGRVAHAVVSLVATCQSFDDLRTCALAQLLPQRRCACMHTMAFAEELAALRAICMAIRSASIGHWPVDETFSSV